MVESLRLDMRWRGNYPEIAKMSSGLSTRHLIADEFLAIKARQEEIRKEEAEQLAKALAAQETRDKEEQAKAEKLAAENASKAS